MFAFSDKFKREYTSNPAHHVVLRCSEAELFAAYLLIPEEKLNAILKEEWVRESPDSILTLAEEFEVSENFMRKRLEFGKVKIGV